MLLALSAALSAATTDRDALLRTLPVGIDGEPLELPEDAAVSWVIPLTVLADGVTHSTVLAAKEDTWTFPTSEQARSWLWRRAAIRAQASIPKHARH